MRAMGESIPVIDVSGLCEADGPQPAALARVAAELAAPCTEWGAFQVVGHGLPGSRLDEVRDAIRALFELPAPTKQAMRRSRFNARGYYDAELTKNRPDWKEVFDYGGERETGPEASRHSDGENLWPAGEARMRALFLEHYADCERLALALLRAVCCSLGLPPDRLDAAFVDHSSFVRLNRYAPCPTPAAADAPLLPDEGLLGVHHHTDAGALTLVLQDDVPGLQVQRGDRFHVVPVVEGAFVVNLGDMLQVWSNDRYRSPVHRVLASRDRTRHSAPFFLNPSYTTSCAPLPELLAGGAAPVFEPVSWSHFRDQRSAGDYADYGAEIQIDDFRIA